MMKKLPGIILILALLSACGDSQKAVDYYKIIINEQNKIRGIYEKFLYSFGNKDLRRTEELRTEAIEQVDESIEKMYSLSDYRGDKSLKLAAIDLFQYYKTTLEKEYLTIMDILRFSKEEGITKKEMNAINERLAKMQNKYVVMNAKFLEAQKKFAKKHDFKIKTTENQ